MAENESSTEQHMPKLAAFASRAEFILELGCAAGNGSTRAFVWGQELLHSPTKLHVSVDLNPAHPTTDRPTVAWWRIVHGDSRSEETAKAVRAISGDRKASIIFIDTDHTYEVMAQELENWKGFADDSTIWLFHDTWMEGKYNHMTDAIKEFAAKEGWKYTDLSKDSHGLGMMRR